MVEMSANTHTQAFASKHTHVKVRVSAKMRGGKKEA